MSSNQAPQYNNSSSNYSNGPPTTQTSGSGKNSGAPNYTGAAQSQEGSAQQNWQQQNRANRPNINTGFGGQSWSQDAQGNWTLNSNLNPALGGALGGLESQASNNAQHGPQDIQADRDKAIQSNYSQATSRLDPQWAQRDESTQSQLVNQGLDPSSQAYRQAETAEGQQRNDAYSSAMNNAIGMGNQTEGMDLQALMSPYQQMGALQGYENNMPGFNAAGYVNPTQYLQALQDSGSYGLQNQAAQNQMWGDIASGAGQAGGAAIMASDERLKKNVERLDVDALPGVPLATFEYKHDPGTTHLGVIAQDLEKVAPQHVHTGPDGIKRVDYSALKPFALK